MVGGGRRMRMRTAATAIAAMVVSGWAIFGGGAGAALAGGEDVAFVDATNASRQELAGAGALHRSADLDEVARRHAEAMVAAGKLFHNPELAQQVQNWSIVAENVGVGYEPSSIHQAFLDSPSHRANVLDGRVTEMGVGTTISSDGRLWVVEVFRKPAAAAAAPAPAATAAAAPAPAPVRRVRPQATPAPVAPAPVEAAAVEAPAAPVAPPVVVPVAVVVPDTAAVDLTPQPAYVAPPVSARAVVTLGTPTLVSASDSGAPVGSSVVLGAVALWLLVAAGLLRQLPRAVAATPATLRRLAVRSA